MIRARGVIHTARELIFRIDNRCHDAVLNVETSGFVDTRDLGYDNLDLVHYAPIGYRALRNAMGRVAIDPAHSVFLDYGCGKGRAVVVAATMPFKRVVGVELSSTLLQQCRENVVSMRRRRALDVELSCVDATTYPVPHDVNVIYFFNPFRGAVLATVFANVERSQREHPRRIHVLYFNDSHFQKLTAGNKRLRCVERGIVYEDISYGHYLLDP